MRSSFGSRRPVYPASASIWAAVSESDPLLGTATRSMGLFSGEGSLASGGAALVRRSSQMSVDVLRRESARDQQHLQVVEELGDLLRGAVVGLVLRGHP